MSSTYYPSKSKFAKITEEQADAIRASADSQRKIANAYGISQTMVSFIKTCKNWRHC